MPQARPAGPFSLFSFRVGGYHPRPRLPGAWGRSSVGRATRSQCVGRGFDSLRLHHPSSAAGLHGPARGRCRGNAMHLRAPRRAAFRQAGRRARASSRTPNAGSGRRPGQAATQESSIEAQASREAGAAPRRCCMNSSDLAQCRRLEIVGKPIAGTSTAGRVAHENTESSKTSNVSQRGIR